MFPDENPMSPYEKLCQQIVVDAERLNALLIRYSAGERHLKDECDRLEGAIQIKKALLKAADR